jgi:hypothetical protein
MRGDPSYSQSELKNWLLGLGFYPLVRENTGYIFLDKKEDTFASFNIWAPEAPFNSLNGH